MSLLRSFLFALPLLQLISSQTKFRYRVFYFQDKYVNYQEAWEGCKQQGLQLATAIWTSDFLRINWLLNSPDYRGEWYWVTDRIEIDRSIPWTFLTFNDQQMTLISETGQRLLTNCTVVRDFMETGSSWSADLCTQQHRYICDELAS